MCLCFFCVTDKNLIGFSIFIEDGCFFWGSVCECALIYCQSVDTETIEVNKKKKTIIHTHKIKRIHKT